jgi:putative ABC transport system permease protein
MSQMPDSEDYILTQYNILAGNIAKEKNQVLLVLNPDDELSDLLLARFGFYTQEEFLEIVYKATEDENYDENIYKNSFHYDELVGKKFYWYPNDTVFKKNTVSIPGMPESVYYTYNPFANDFEANDAVELEVVGIITPKDTVNYGALTSGIYYTKDLTDHILEANKDSEIFEYIKSIDESDTNTATAMMKYYISYEYTYTYAPKGETAEPKKAFGAVGPSITMADMMSSMNGGSESAFDHSDMKERFIRNLGGNDLANNLLIYPVSFDNKDLVTEYLDAWNNDKLDITVGDKTLTYSDRGGDIAYTDALELVIQMINTMIDVVSYALIAFTSISLVVSTVMIGIITYVSVVERIKEIGVIRSLGGRKKDVSHLFNAETFILGLLAGIIGVSFTYLISIPVNLILSPLINYPSIAALPISSAVILIVLSVCLTLISGLIPAKSAAKKDPVVALRTE